MQSPFMYLHKRKLTIPQDSDTYDRANRTLYRKQAFKFIYMVLLCKLYDMSNLPMMRSHKVYVYTGIVLTLSSISFFMASQPLTDMLMKLDQKYQAVYQKNIKSKSYQGIP